MYLLDFYAVDPVGAEGLSDDALDVVEAIQGGFQGQARGFRDLDGSAVAPRVLALRAMGWTYKRIAKALGAPYAVAMERERAGRLHTLRWSTAIGAIVVGLPLAGSAFADLSISVGRSAFVQVHAGFGALSVRWGTRPSPGTRLVTASCSSDALLEYYGVIEIAAWPVRVSSREITVRLWLPFLGLALSSAYLFGARRGAAFDPSCCRRCGYPLEPNAPSLGRVQVCPECGAENRPVGAATSTSSLPEALLTGSPPQTPAGSR